MHTVQIYIDETLDADGLSNMRASLLDMPHVENVALSARDPHDVLVEYEEKYVQPMDILASMSRRGLHPDVISG